MPTDYTSTARSLALPISPLHSPTTTRAPPRKFWPRTASYASNRVRSPSPYSNGNSRSVRDSVLSQAEKWRRWIFRMFFKLSPVQQIASVFALLVTFVLGVLFLVYNEQIFQWLEPFAENWASIRGGWLILWFMIFVTAFPPIIGYSTCLTISGFVYGFPQGWFIAATATVVGSLTSFIVSRTLLSSYVHRLVASDSSFTALSSVLKHDGLPLLTMIRLCPLPYSLSNGFLSTIATVKPFYFALATTIASPKLAIHVFIGWRLAAIAKSPDKKDPVAKAVNYTSIAAGIILGVLVGWWIWRRTIARSRQLEAEERRGLASRPRPSLSHPDEFADDLSDDNGAGPDDGIDFLETDRRIGENEGEYEDEEGGIGLDRQPAKR